MEFSQDPQNIIFGIIGVIISWRIFIKIIDKIIEWILYAIFSLLQIVTGVLWRILWKYIDIFILGILLESSKNNIQYMNICYILCAIIIFFRIRKSIMG
jgi:hypothetical protein